MSEKTIGILDLIQPTTWPAKLKDWSRGWPLLIIFLVALAVVSLASPAKVTLGVWGVAKLAIGGYAMLWTHRWAFPYARPHKLLNDKGVPPDLMSAIAFGISCLCRTLLMAAGIIAAGFIP